MFNILKQARQSRALEGLKRTLNKHMLRDIGLSPEGEADSRKSWRELMVEDRAYWLR